MGNAPYFKFITLDVIREAYKRMGYTFYTGGNYNVNIFAVRTNDDRSNAFNDVIGIAYKDEGNWILDVYNATVDPGLPYRTCPVNKKGCAVIVPNQYRGCWRIGLHKGKYPALVQNKAICLYRDNNKDEIIDCDPSTVTSELAGINIHHAGADSKHVDKWSAGCMVIASEKDWNRFFRVITESAKRYGEVFTATIFTEQQVFG